MGRLVNPGAGELTDRLTILSLKLLYGEQSGRDVTHFKTERATLLTQIRSRTLNGIWFDKVLELAAVNAALWQVEDELRHWRNESGGKVQNCEQAVIDEIAELAFRIQGLNDVRAVLIERINKDTGEFIGVGTEAREKVYEPA